MVNLEKYKMRNYSRIVVVLLLFSSLSIAINPWGFYAHKRANRYAVFTLPEELIGFYKKHIDYLKEHAVDADKRRYAIKEEAPRYHGCLLKIILKHYNN